MNARRRPSAAIAAALGDSDEITESGKEGIAHVALEMLAAMNRTWIEMRHRHEGHAAVQRAGVEEGLERFQPTGWFRCRIASADLFRCFLDHEMPFPAERECLVACYS